MEAATRTLGGLDVLVNNAGIEIAKPVTEHTDDEYRGSASDVNVWGVFLCTKYAVPALADGGGIDHQHGLRCRSWRRGPVLVPTARPRPP